MSDNNPVAAAIDAGGKVLYIANSGGNSVTGYSINATTGAVSPIAGARVTTNFAPNGLAIDPSSAFLYVSTAFGNSGDVEGFSINPASGALTAFGLLHAHTRDPRLAAMPKEALEALAKAYDDVLAKCPLLALNAAQDAPQNQIESKPAIEAEVVESERPRAQREQQKLIAPKARVVGTIARDNARCARCDRVWSALPPRRVLD